MTYTIDRIKELVPEAELRIDGMDMDFRGKPFPRDWFQALLTARAENERLRGALKQIARLAAVDKSCSLEAQGWDQLEIERYSGREECAIIARHALEKGE